MEKRLLEELDIYANSAPPKVMSLIRIEESDDERGLYNSRDFIGRNELIKNLLGPNEHKLLSTKLSDAPESSEISIRQFTDTVIISPWKNVENISARLVENFDQTVILECLIDKDSGIYEEREFRASLFSGYKLDIGNLFYLRIFERQNEIKMEIHDDPNLTREEDFPKLDFVKEFGNSRLFKKE